MNPDCYYGDHEWRGTSACVHCGERLRCGCGCYVREDNLDAHLETCRVYGILPGVGAAAVPLAEEET